VRKSVEEGKLWERRGAILHNHILPNKMKNGWQCFFQMDVYTWIPSILLERNKTPWLPMCPNRSCNRQCVKNGFNKPPRIVYGMHENYILNAPERYICKACSTTRKLQIESGMQSKGATKAEWNSLDRAVMEQVKDRNPGIFYEFPCVLSSQTCFSVVQIVS